MKELYKKKGRADYLADTFKFIEILTNISLKLKSLKGEERKPELKKYVKRINKWMQTVRRKHILDKDE